MWAPIGFCFILVCTQMSTVPAQFQDTDESRLRKHLFSSIDQTMRPLANHNDTITVDVLLDITHVRSLDETIGTITVNGLMKLSWTIEAYRWNSRLFGGISHLTLPSDFLWKPDISAYNSAQSNDVNNHEHSTLFLDEDGHVHWLRQVTFWTTCQMDHRLFPFDEQLCDIVLGSWSGDASSVRFQLAEEHNHSQVVLLEFYTENPQWELFRVEAASRHLSTAECCSEPYNVVEYKLQLRRRASFQKVLLFIPCLVATLLTLALYWLPPNASEKIVLGSVVLMVQVVLLLFMGWIIPQGGPSVPVIVLYCGNSLILTLLTLFISIIVINISRSRNYRTPVPAAVKNIITGPLGKVLCIGSHHYQDRRVKLLDENHVELRDTNNHMIDGQDGHSTASYADWMVVATVIDRFCFVLYCVAVVIIIAISFHS